MAPPRNGYGSGLPCPTSTNIWCTLGQTNNWPINIFDFFGNDTYTQLKNAINNVLKIKMRYRCWPETNGLQLFCSPPTDCPDFQACLTIDAVSVRIQFVLETAPSLDPPKSKWHDGQRQINEGKYSLKNEIQRWRPSSGMPRGRVNRIRLFGRFGVITTQASKLVQVGDGVLIGQRTWWLMT